MYFVLYLSLLRVKIFSSKKTSKNPSTNRWNVTKNRVLQLTPPSSTRRAALCRLFSLLQKTPIITSSLARSKKFALETSSTSFLEGWQIGFRTLRRRFKRKTPGRETRIRSRETLDEKRAERKHSKEKATFFLASFFSLNYFNLLFLLKNLWSDPRDRTIREKTLGMWNSQTSTTTPNSTIVTLQLQLLTYFGLDWIKKWFNGYNTKNTPRETRTEKILLKNIGSVLFENETNLYEDDHRPHIILLFFYIFKKSILLRSTLKINFCNKKSPPWGFCLLPRPTSSSIALIKLIVL